ncbi:Na+/H+ antiporter subunit E [Aquincola sp. MAHUQ-54]|uniref:Na+/H+ antiporter subunit E n=1 Tax=Aquincola agrisoli TaxID=3119538 RepID=A0AAW9QJ60_9BURK
MMRRLLPSPLLSAALLVLWLLLADSLGAGQWLLGAAVAVGMPLLTATLRPEAVRIRRPGVLLALVLRVGGDVLRSNFDVLRGVLRAVPPGGRPPNSGFVRVPITLRDPHALASLAIILAVVPGTVWCRLSPDGTELLLHVFDLEDEAALVTQIHERYEQPLMEIFE